MDAQPGMMATASLNRDDCLVNAGLSLPRGSTLRIEDGLHTLVRVRGGCVWITQECELHDEILESGQRFRISREGRTLVTAIEKSLVALELPYCAHLPRRIELSSRGAARVLAVHEARRGLLGRVASLGARLTEVWLRLYATGRRRATPLI